MRSQVFSSLLKQVTQPARRASQAIPQSVQTTLPRVQVPITSSRFRAYSQQPPARKIFTFQDVKAHIGSPTPNRILIDTREPGELQQTGTIPGAVNIPIKSRPDSFHITAEEFEDRFGFERPGKDTEIVLFCKAGVRSRAAAELARQQGWEKVIEYEGSWLDWDGNGGEKEPVR